MKLFLMKRADCLFTEKVYNKIEEDIAEGRLYPGERILVAKMAEDLGCSHAPIREALRQLESEALLRFERNGGCTVRKLSIPELDEIHGVLLLLEGDAVRIGTERANGDDIAQLRSPYNKLGTHSDGYATSFCQTCKATQENN